MIIELLLLAVPAIHGQTWTTQSAMIPEFEWVVLDHADGNSMGYGVTVANGHVFVSGSMRNIVQVENPQTGISVATTDQGSDGDVFLAKVSLDGTPTDVWAYGGSSSEIPTHLAASPDGEYISMTGYFAGTITFGDFTFTNTKTGSTETHSRDADDGYVVKVASADGEIIWARQYTSDPETKCHGTAFDPSGNIVVVGERCEGDACRGFVALLASADGETIWEHDYGTEVASLDDVVVDDNGNFYLVGELQGSVDIDGVTMSSDMDSKTDALLIVLDSDGAGSWGATITGDIGANSALVEVVDDNVYMQCGSFSGAGACKTVSTTASSNTLSMESTHVSGFGGGNIVKISTSGEPLWGADTSWVTGMAVTSDAVYFNIHGSGSLTFGDTTFSSWGSFDQYVAKLDAESGSGEWMLQTGGEGIEYVRRMASDSNGDVYAVGLTNSNPSYFDPLSLEAHDTTDGYDVFVAKLRATNEMLPSCKTDQTTITDGYCFVNNVCYEDGATSRGDACMTCSASNSQTSFTLTGDYCYIDGVCYADGEAGSTCQSCDISQTTTSWTLNSDEFDLAADGSCRALTTWTSQSSMLPEFQWVVLDHGDGNSHSYAFIAGAGSVFVAGSMQNTITVTNFETGESLESSDQGSDGDIYLARVSPEGVPESLWLFEGSSADFATQLAISTDEAYLAMTGFFEGSIDLGSETFQNEGDGRDGFVVKISTDDGSILWAHHLPGTGDLDTTSWGTAFDAEGNVAVSGAGYAKLLAADDGSVLWEHDFGTFMSIWDVEIVDGVYALCGWIQGSVSLGNVDLSSTSNDYIDAVLIVMNRDGEAQWGATVTGDQQSVCNDFAVQEDAIYMGCGGACKDVETNSGESLTVSGTSVINEWFTGAILKFSLDGVPIWGADTGYVFRVDSTPDSVFVNYLIQNSETYGDTTFESWGSFDTVVVKLDAETGAGHWVIQVGGQGEEAPNCNLGVDANGDVYLLGYIHSHPAYFEPLVVDTHDITDGYDSFIAKLETSNEKLPACKTDANTVADGYCFVANACYADGAPSRSITKASCVSCRAEIDQMSLSLNEGAFLDSNGNCIEPIAAYIASTDVSTHAMIDLDAKEIEQFSDLADWEMALFVYENGGGGLCSEEDIATTDETHPCYGKSTSDAAGNSIKGSGEIRTIHGFATSGRAKMSEWPMWNLYRDYWNDDNYADTFIRNALAEDGAWSSRSDALRAEMSEKGAKYQAVWMYVIHEMEDAVSDCRAGDIFDNEDSNSAGDSPHAWDEAWAFYAGSLEGEDGSGRGYLLWDLAEKRCPQFGTCDNDGVALANVKALAIANDGLEKILDADCDGVAEELNKMTVQMTIPLLQGLVRYLYLADPAVNGGSCTDGVCTYDKAWAEGWAFAAAVLPQVDECDSSVAELLVANLDVDGPSTPLADGYESVKARLESTYSCMGITCADVGEYQNDNGDVYPGMDACEDKSSAGWIIHRVDVSAPHAAEVHTGDIDGDGTIDIVAASWGDHRYVWHDNLDGSGKKWSEVLISDNSDGIGNGPSTAYVCDMNGDGALDVITASLDDHVIAWHENAGDGSAWTEHIIDGTDATASPYSVICADLTSAGQMGVVSASFESGTVEWHSRSGSQWSTTTLTDNAAGAHSVTVADVDGDGDDDVVVATDDALLWLENPSWTRHVIDTLYVGVDVVAGDIDNDGDIDFVSASYNDNKIYVHVNGNSGFWTAPISTEVGGAYSVALADFDLDGLMDVVSCGWTSGGVYVHLQVEDPSNQPYETSWVTTEIADEAATGANSVWAADINGDGMMDVVVAMSEGSVEWFENPASASPIESEFEPIAGYGASTDVSTHAMIDLDAKEIEQFSDLADWEMALFVYENGGGGLCSEEDIATTDETHPCYGKSTSDAAGNSIKGSGEIRTIHGFATSGRAKMSEWPMWNLYRDYWNDDNYADTFIRNALAEDGAWSSRSDALRAEMSEKGAKYQAVWMYVIHEMEDAVADCRAGDIFDNEDSNSAGDSPHAWDEAWAFYAGSLEGEDGSGRGYLLWDLAEKRCPQFGTCDNDGAALANVKALAIANDGLEKILDADCDGVAEELNKMTVQMTIPLLQGLVRYLYLADPAVNGGSCTDGVCTYDKAWAEGWAFAAAVLPQVDECDSSVAELLVANLDVDGPSTPLADGYESVKARLESTYSCMGITCADVGEYQDDNGDVYPGMDACSDGDVPSEPSEPSERTITSKKTKTKTDWTVVIALAIALGVLFCLVLALTAKICMDKKKGGHSDQIYRYKKTKSGLVTEIRDDDSVTTASDVDKIDIELTGGNRV